ncbi:MAG: efflux transporter outer membrane subunit [Ignavibacteriaceae bacterium]
MKRNKIYLSSIIFFIIPAVIFILSGCTVGPNYIRPDATSIPSNYTNASSEWKIAVPKDTLSKGNWWEIFGDTVLNKLETDAMDSNQTLRASLARFEQARAQADVVSSGLFPKISAGVNATRQKDSENRPLNNTGKEAGEGFTCNNFSIPFNLNYELDLWGKIRRQVEAANANLQANYDYLEWIKLEIASEVAADYFTLRALDTYKVLIDSTVEVYRKTFQLVKNRRAGGLASDLEVAQAETILKTAEAQLPDNELQRKKFQNALAVLTGKNASLYNIPPEALNILPLVIPPGLPSELLERRPDVASVERLMAAANANIGVAVSAFYPSISLGGTAGWQSTNIANLINAPSTLWSVGASLFQPLFEGGKLSAQLRAAKSSYDESVANYRQTVLLAFADVENNLSAQRLLAQQYEAEVSALRSAQRQYQIAGNQYKAGLITYLDVSSASATVLTLQSNVSRILNERFVAAVALIKSLGGEWQNHDNKRE